MIQKLQQFWRYVLRRMSLSGVVGVVVLLIVVSLVAGSIQAIQENFQRQIEVDRLAQEVALLEVENETIRLQNQYYQTDEYLELQARKLLGRAASGEKVIILPPTTLTAPPRQTGEANNAVPLSERSNLEQWLYFLFSDKKINQVR